MDELKIYLVAFLCIAVFFFFQSRNYKKNKKLRIEKMLKNDWGACPKREYKGVEFQKIRRYYDLLIEAGRSDNVSVAHIDDITWNDMGMDSVFKSMNHTWSSIGEDYLYNRLRRMDYTDKELEEFDKLVTYMENNPADAYKLQEEFVEIGRTKSVCIYEFICKLAALKTRSNIKHIAMSVLLLISIGIIFVEPIVGVGASIAMVVVNIMQYYRTKAEIENYFVCFSYIIRMISGAKKLGDIKCDGMSSYTERICRIYEHVKGMTKGVFLVAGNNMSGSLAEILMEYLRMLFHVDIMKFNSMLKSVHDNEEELCKLYEILGMLEASCAVASYRTYLRKNYGYYCKPDFISLDIKNNNRGVKKIKGDNIYHPLIEKPVTNSICEGKCVLLTGSNASGKSTFLKTVGINAILAQTIYTCTGQKFAMERRNVYSSMSLKDNLENNESYYMVEIKALKRIIDAANRGERIICFVDEVLRGTNTVERVSASTEILKSFAMSDEDVLAFAATHDIELTHLLEEWYANYHFEEDVVDDDVLFNYKLNTGRAVSRNAIQLLKVMGYDDKIISAAKMRADKFTKTGQY